MDFAHKFSYILPDMSDAPILTVAEILSTKKNKEATSVKVYLLVEGRSATVTTSKFNANAISKMLMMTQA